MPPPERNRDGVTTLLEPPPNAHLTAEGLDAWAQDTNGAPFSQETKDELVEFLDVTDDGRLTLVACIGLDCRDLMNATLGSRDFYKYINYRQRMTRKRHGGTW